MTESRGMRAAPHSIRTKAGIHLSPTHRRRIVLLLLLLLLIWHERYPRPWRWIVRQSLMEYHLTLAPGILPVRYPQAFKVIIPLLVEPRYLGVIVPQHMLLEIGVLSYEILDLLEVPIP